MGVAGHTVAVIGVVELVAFVVMRGGLYKYSLPHASCVRAEQMMGKSGHPLRLFPYFQINTHTHTHTGMKGREGKGRDS